MLHPLHTVSNISYKSIHAPFPVAIIIVDVVHCVLDVVTTRELAVVATAANTPSRIVIVRRIS